jgi:hypothetical protein
MTVEKARYALFIRGLEASPVERVRVEDSVFRRVAEGSLLQNVRELVLRDVVLEPAR